MASSRCHLSHLQRFPSAVARSAAMGLSAVSPCYRLAVSHASVHVHARPHAVPHMRMHASFGGS